MSSPVRETIRETLRASTVRYTLLGDGVVNGVPPNALVDRDGNPILDAEGNYIIVGH